MNVLYYASASTGYRVVYAIPVTLEYCVLDGGNKRQELNWIARWDNDVVLESKHCLSY